MDIEGLEGRGQQARPFQQHMAAITERTSKWRATYAKCLPPFPTRTSLQNLAPLNLRYNPTSPQEFVPLIKTYPSIAALTVYINDNTMCSSSMTLAILLRSRCFLRAFHWRIGISLRNLSRYWRSKQLYVMLTVWRFEILRCNLQPKAGKSRKFEFLRWMTGIWFA